MTDREFLTDVLPQWPRSCVYEIAANERSAMIWWKHAGATCRLLLPFEDGASANLEILVESALPGYERKSQVTRWITVTGYDSVRIEVEDALRGLPR